eukprot:TRINITY_DN37795_c0_g1_i1.p1 TRINITY_DN37795_c0_g1~~TRINITY_DN37795_c0_g1_i1.p1  ORF type:complete len:211 (+),score=25.96 TRINITY_DN37795_c0_g1_i1:28-633(+)
MPVPTSKPRGCKAARQATAPGASSRYRRCRDCPLLVVLLGLVLAFTRASWSFSLSIKPHASRRDVLSGLGKSMAAGSLAMEPFGASAVEIVPDTDSFPEVTTPSGLKYKEVQKGSGDSPTPGTKVTIDYTMYTFNRFGPILLDRTKDRGEPFSFVLGNSSIIDGLNEARLQRPFEAAAAKRLRQIPALQECLCEPFETESA